MPITAKLDELGKPAWIALMVLGLHGLVAARPGDPRLHDMERTNGMRISRRLRPLAAQDGAHAAQDGLDARQNGRRRLAVGARAFERQSRLRRIPRRDPASRLEEEQREFREFLERLRFAKDKAEFDQFMAERRNRPTRREPPPPQN